MLKTNAHQNTIQSENNKHEKSIKKRKKCSPALAAVSAGEGRSHRERLVLLLSWTLHAPRPGLNQGPPLSAQSFSGNLPLNPKPKTEAAISNITGQRWHSGVIAELLTVTLSQLQPSSSCCDSCTRSWQQWRKFSSLSSEELISLVQQCFKGRPTSEQNKGQTFTQVSLTQCATHWH